MHTVCLHMETKSEYETSTKQLSCQDSKTVGKNPQLGKQLQGASGGGY
jgi:hypothetical protein